MNYADYYFLLFVVCVVGFVAASSITASVVFFLAAVACLCGTVSEMRSP